MDKFPVRVERAAMHSNVGLIRNMNTGQVIRQLPAFDIEYLLGGRNYAYWEAFLDDDKVLSLGNEIPREKFE